MADPPGSSYRVPVPPEVKTFLQELARDLKKGMPPGWGFGIFMFEYGEPPSTMVWISSAERSNIVKALQEWMRVEGS